MGHWSAIGAESPVPLERIWGAQGTTNGFRDNAGVQNQVDSLLKSFIQGNGVRHAQVAVRKSGNVLLERAYTWTEPGRYQTQTTDKMLLASLSKMFCAAAIQTLIDDNALSLHTKPWNEFHDYPWRGSSGSGLLDVRLKFITIQQLLDHQGGWNRTASSDLAFQMIKATRFLGKSTPPDLSEFVERITVSVRLDFLERIGLADQAIIFTTSMFDHLNDQMTQETFFYGPNFEHPQFDSNADPVASVYGGDGQYEETEIGPSSIAASASTLVKLMSKHAVWGIGQRCNHDLAPRMDATNPLGAQHPCTRDGSQEGARGWAESRVDGLDWAVILNTRNFAGGGDGDSAFVNVLESGISAILDDS